MIEDHKICRECEHFRDQCQECQYFLMRLTPQKLLVGEVITKLEIEKGKQEHLRFTTEAKHQIIFYTESDQSSKTWFQDIIGVKNLLNHRVITWDTVDMSHIKVPASSEYYEDKLYKVMLVTDIGVVDIIFRNSSYGPYGGEIFWTCRLPEDAEMIELTDDYPN